MTFTDTMLQRIRELYEPPYVRGVIAQQAREWGCPCSHITHQARKLGLKQLSWNVGSRRWSTDEIQLMRRNPHYTNQAMANALQRQGFHRTANAVYLFRLRDGWNRTLERDEATVGYSAKGLSELMGVDPTTVVRWVRLGWLKGMCEGGSDIRCSSYRIQPKDLVRFLKHYIHYWEPGKADKYWLMDILTGDNL